MLTALSLQERGKKKRGRFLLLDTKTGGEVNTQSLARPCASRFSRLKIVRFHGGAGKKKTLIRPSRRSGGIKNETSIPGLNRGFFFSARPERLRMSTVSYVAKY